MEKACDCECARFTLRVVLIVVLGGGLDPLMSPFTLRVVLIVVLLVVLWVGLDPLKLPFTLRVVLMVVLLVVLCVWVRSVILWGNDPSLARGSGGIETCSPYLGYRFAQPAVDKNKCVCVCACVF